MVIYSTTNDNWASVFDSQPKTTQQSTGVWDSLSSQASTAPTITGKNSVKFLNFPTPENIAVIYLKFKQDIKP